jgi:hypothetical protein
MPHIPTRPIDPPKGAVITKTYDVMFCAGGSGNTIKYWHDVTDPYYEQGLASFVDNEDKKVVISGDYVIKEN